MDESDEISFYSPPIEYCVDWDRIHGVIRGEDLIAFFKLKCANGEGFKSFFSDCRKGQVDLLLSISKFFNVKSSEPSFSVEVIESEVTYFGKTFDELSEAVLFCNDLLETTDKELYTLESLCKENFDDMIFMGEDVSIYHLQCS
jgi:hypothetical protein